MSTDNIHFIELVQRCRDHDRKAQNELYQMFYSYGMSICIRYVESQDEAITILNNGYLRIFSHLNSYDTTRDFKPWFKTIMVRSAINYLKKMKKYKVEMNLEEARGLHREEDLLSRFNYYDLVEMIQSLSLAYRTVFNMYVIDGFKHKEIAKSLGITVSTSKSNLTRAKENLRHLINKKNGV
jgi:RNA polymerase sigma-70 factor (ECF subfamily)